MPVYSFRCRACGLEFEELVARIGQSAPCPQCGRKDVERLMTVPAAHRGRGGGDGSGCGTSARSGFS